MAKKILIGFAAVAIGCVIAGSGYQAGKSLAQRDMTVEADFKAGNRTG